MGQPALALLVKFTHVQSTNQTLFSHFQVPSLFLFSELSKSINTNSQAHLQNKLRHQKEKGMFKKYEEIVSGAFFKCWLCNNSIESSYITYMEIEHTGEDQDQRVNWLRLFNSWQIHQIRKEEEKDDCIQVGDNAQKAESLQEDREVGFDSL